MSNPTCEGHVTMQLHLVAGFVVARALCNYLSVCYNVTTTTEIKCAVNAMGLHLPETIPHPHPVGGHTVFHQTRPRGQKGGYALRGNPLGHFQKHWHRGCHGASTLFLSPSGRQGWPQFLRFSLGPSPERCAHDASCQSLASIPCWAWKRGPVQCPRVTSRGDLNTNSYLGRPQWAACPGPVPFLGKGVSLPPAEPHPWKAPPSSEHMPITVRPSRPRLAVSSLRVTFLLSPPSSQRLSGSCRLALRGHLGSCCLWALSV